jgi:uncharacterized GH25 family protein
MKRSLIVGLLLSVALVSVGLAHDMFLKLASYFVAENTEISIPLLNGTFTKSENSIDRDRLADISLVSPAGRARLDTAVATARANKTFFKAKTGAAGTYVFGVATKPRQLAMGGKAFAAYLTEEGLGDVLAVRKKAGQAADSATEQYSKHVKAIIQVGKARTDGFATVLGYPSELVPIQNPYTLKPGATLDVKAMIQGKRAANVVVLAGGRGARGAFREQSVRTGPDGIARIKLPVAGTYYIKFISMNKVTHPHLDYESFWTTLTFELR